MNNLIKCKQILINCLRENEDNIPYLIDLVDYFILNKVPRTRDTYKVFNDELFNTFLHVGDSNLMNALLILDLEDECTK